MILFNDSVIEVTLGHFVTTLACRQDAKKGVPHSVRPKIEKSKRKFRDIDHTSVSFIPQQLIESISSNVLNPFVIAISVRGTSLVAGVAIVFETEGGGMKSRGRQTENKSMASVAPSPTSGSPSPAGDEDLELTVLTIKQCFVNKVPPLASSEGHRAENWDRTAIWDGRLRYGRECLRRQPSHFYHPYFLLYFIFQYRCQGKTNHCLT